MEFIEGIPGNYNLSIYIQILGKQIYLKELNFIIITLNIRLHKQI